jgi:hypothetical protein
VEKTWCGDKALLGDGKGSKDGAEASLGGDRTKVHFPTGNGRRRGASSVPLPYFLQIGNEDEEEGREGREGRIGAREGRKEGSEILNEERTEGSEILKEGRIGVPEGRKDRSS